jgi:pimeloyl-ACP methyl ester carboxylesterase
MMRRNETSGKRAWNGPTHKSVSLSILTILSVFILASSLRLLAQSNVVGSPSLRVGLEPCALPNVEGEAKCGSYEVFEDRTRSTGRKIGLNIAVLPALNPKPTPDPVFWLHGGPGAAATDLVGAAKGGFLEGLRKDHDLIFVDQRGTGKSNPLKCDIGDDPSDLQSYFGKLFPSNVVRACREKLQPLADLRLYTTSIAMDDLDEVRRALGYGKIDIVAASYGTIAAQVYMRQYPESVRSVFLVGVATPGVKQPLLFARGAQHALDLLYIDCAADTTCNNAFPNLKSEFAALLARFDHGPVEVNMLNPSTQVMQHIWLERENFVERIRLLLYTTTFARFVPLVIHKAYEGDFFPFETISVRYNPGSLLSRGMYFTVTCSEGVPFITEQEIVTEAKGTFVGARRVRAHIEACKEWVRGNVPKIFTDPIKSNIPVLMVSGEVDGSSPSWFGASAVKYLANGTQVKIRYYGHQIDDPCVVRIEEEFVRRASFRGIDTSCTQQIRRPPFATSIPTSFSLKTPGG